MTATAASTSHEDASAGVAPRARCAYARPPRNPPNQPDPPHEFVCPECDRSFSTAIGLGVHRSRSHREEVNAEIRLPSVKRRWNQEELRLLAREEALAISSGVRFVNQHLREVFGGERTVESIKGVRRGEEYKALVEAAIADLNATPEEVAHVPHSPPVGTSSPEERSPGEHADISRQSEAAVDDVTTSSPTQASLPKQQLGVADSMEVTLPGEPTVGEESPISPARASPRARTSGSWSAAYGSIEDAILRRTPIVEQIRAFRAAGHVGAVFDCLSDRRSEGCRVWLQEVFPPPPEGRNRKTKNNDDVSGRVPKKRLRRREYARVQRLSESTISRAAREILDGAVEYRIPDVEVMTEHWGPYVSQPSLEAPPGAKG